MSLVPCKECGNQISALARTCPQCGAPCGILVTPPAKPKRETSRIEKVIGTITLLAIIYGLIESSTSEQSDHRSGCAADDLVCIGRKFDIYSGYKCMSKIERLAKYNAKWIDRSLEYKFSRFRWADKAIGSVTLIGDSAQFQNGFGAYMPVIYECDLSADGNTVLDVRVREGRLPD